MKAKWKKVDKQAAEKLTVATLSPGVVFPLATSDLPAGFQRMPNAVSYFVSAYTSPVPTTPGVSAAGEIAVIRRDEDVSKAYNYVFATSSGGNVYLTGPFKDFQCHHMATTSSVAVSELFGHSPWRK
jgi:hypothetical protein